MELQLKVDHLLLHNMWSSSPDHCGGYVMKISVLRKNVPWNKVSLKNFVLGQKTVCEILSHPAGVGLGVHWLCVHCPQQKD